MALYLDRNNYGLFSSKDLKHWEKLSQVTIPGTSECPEFFEIALDGNKRDTRWIFYGGNGGYLVGKFDGQIFHARIRPPRAAPGQLLVCLPNLYGYSAKRWPPDPHSLGADEHTGHAF